MKKIETKIQRDEKKYKRQFEKIVFEFENVDNEKRRRRNAIIFIFIFANVNRSIFVVKNFSFLRFFIAHDFFFSRIENNFDVAINANIIERKFDNSKNAQRVQKSHKVEQQRNLTNHQRYVAKKTSKKFEKKSKKKKSINMKSTKHVVVE